MPKQKKPSKQQKPTQTQPEAKPEQAKTVENPPKTSPQRFPGNSW